MTDYSKDEDIKRLQVEATRLTEHFDTVQIFCTTVRNGETFSVTAGKGNWYARKGQIDEFIVKCDQEVRDNVSSGSYD